MKILIYFSSCFSLLVLVGCHPEQQCFRAQMKVWDTTEIKRGEKGSGYEQILRKEINGADYLITDYDGNPTNVKAQYEADAWVRCMKK